MIIYNVISLGLMIFGLGLVGRGLSQRTESCPPIPSWNPKLWRPIWKVREWFTPEGFRDHKIGWVLISAALILQIVSRWVVPLD